MELIDIFKKEIFEPMNYKIPGRYKFYRTIINACFEYLREGNNEDIIRKYDNSCIVVYGDVSTINCEDIFNATVHYFHRHVYMLNIFYCRSQMIACNKNYCSSTLAYTLYNRMITGPWWRETSERCKKSGLGYQESCDGKVQTRKCQGYFSMW